MVLPLSSGIIGCNHLVQTPLFVRPVGKEISRSDAMFTFGLLKPNYFKKQRSSSSFLLTKGNNTDQNGPGVLSRLVPCI